MSAISVKRGAVEVKCASSIVVGRYKKRQIILHPSMLSYSQANPTQPEGAVLDFDRPLDLKRDFLLPPLGETGLSIVMIGDDVLKLIVKCKSEKSKLTGEVTVLLEPALLQKLTLKFSSAGERDDWARFIIAESDNIELYGLMDTTLVAEDFIKAAHNEIWNFILLGNEPLRKAYIAPAGSEHFELMRLLLENVVSFLLALLGVDRLGKLHAEVFVAFLSVIIQDPAARALLILMRPNESFLLDFKVDTVAGLYITADSTELQQSVASQECSAALSFVQFFQKGVQSPTWKPHRSFLAIIDHPAMPLRADATTEYVEKVASPGEELAWARTKRSELATTFTWPMMQAALDKVPYLAYHFIMAKIQDVTDAERLRGGLLLLHRVSEAHQHFMFPAYHVGQHHEKVMNAVSVEPMEVSCHFQELRDFAAFSEMWRSVMPPTLPLSSMRAAWHLLRQRESPALAGLFLPQTPDLPGEPRSYAVSVRKCAIITIGRNDSLSQSSLLPALGSTPQEIPAAAVDISAHHQLVDRLAKWVLNLLGGRQNHLQESDGALFTALFAAAAADVAMRAFIVTFLPTPSMVAEFTKSATYAQVAQPAHTSDDAITVRSAAAQIVKLLAKTFRSKHWQQYRSFVNVLHHPALNAGELDEAEPSWIDESQWIHERLQMRSPQISWQEMEHVITATPYIHLLAVTKALPTVQQQKAAMINIPNKFLVHKPAANAESAPSFVGLCLDEGTSEWALEVFQERDLINDDFFAALLCEAASDPAHTRLLQAFRVLQKVLYAYSPTRLSHCGGNIWNVKALSNAPHLSSVLITFLWDISQRPDFRRDEKIIGNLILLVLQLESCSSLDAVANATTLASEWMRRDASFANTMFNTMDALKFPKWFSRLCLNFSKHYGQIAGSTPEPELFMDPIYDPPEEPDEGDADVILDATIPLTKHALSMGIVGFFSLCVEFKPETLCEFAAGLGIGRPFFSFFLHQNEPLREQVIHSLCTILRIRPGTRLHARVHECFLLYDNDHLSRAALATLGLRDSTVTSACHNLMESEFTDLLTVAMYMHDLRDLDVRFEDIVISMIADQERREMLMKLVDWIMSYYVQRDIARECGSFNTKTSERSRWLNCEKFTTTTFEDIVECAAEASTASSLLRGAARSSGSTMLERLFEHYIRQCEPAMWKALFRGAKTIAFYVKYVDAEDLDLAFSEFYKMNPGNNCFKHHLLKVRKLLTTPIVSAQDLIQLTSTSSSFDDDSASRFFNQLYEKASRLPASQVDLKMAYLLTASWMKIMKNNVLCPLPPRNAQIITLLTVASWAKSLLAKGDKSMGKALIAQVGTGEGKSLIIAMMAIYFVKVLDKRVHILENNPGLLSKDVEMMKPLFASFGIKTQHEGPGAELKPRLTWTSTEKQTSRDCRSEFCKAGVTYCLRRNLERYYQDSIMAEDYSPLANTVLIVDEVDDLIVDENPNQPYAAKDSDQPAFQAACREAQVECDRAELEGEEFDVGYFANGDFVRETAAEACLKAKSMVLGVDYAIVGGKYVILIDGRPYELYDPALECLKFIRDGQQPYFCSTYYVQSIPYILSQYDCITGFSATLGSPSERDFLAVQYKAWSFDTPSILNTCADVYKVPPSLMDDAVHPGVSAVHVYATTDEQMGKIVEMCLRLHMKVPVLVIAKSTEEALEIEARVKAAMAAAAPSLAGSGRNKFVQLFRQYKLGTMTLDKQNWDHIVRRATSKGPEEDRYCVTITDPFGGRGHDYDVHDDEVDRQGGLAVIMTSIPASEREWRQWKGRTARKDNKGQYAVVLSKEHSPVTEVVDILVDYALRNSATYAVIPNLYEERLIDRLLSVRDATQFHKLKALESDILKGRRLNRLCDKFYEAYGPMKESTWPESAEEATLRRLLSEDFVANGAITKAFVDFALDEHDTSEPVFAAPDPGTPSFWSAKSAAEWEAIKTKSADEHDSHRHSPPPPPFSAQTDSPSERPDLGGEPDESDDNADEPTPPAPPPAIRARIAKFATLRPATREARIRPVIQEAHTRTAISTNTVLVTSAANRTANLVRGAAFAREVLVLDTVCVGETIRTTNLTGPSLQALLSTVTDGEPLDVAVYDIVGPNAGNAVVGLVVTGAITTTATAYTLIVHVKAIFEESQYSISLYGKKRLNVLYGDVILLSAEVLLLPAPTLRPPAELAFHDASTDGKIPAGGHVLISSRDDPRSTPESPVFFPVSVPYTGGNITLPPNLPDCIITVSPDIPGYSNEYSEKFLLFGGEVVPAAHKMLLSADDLSAGEWRVVLSWGEHPRDLDLYCITDFEPRRVYFGAKNAGGRNDASKGNIELDIDVRNGFGPETIVFTPNPTRKYRFLVHNFTGNGEATLSNSGAKIVVYIGGGRPIQFEVPSDVVVDDSGRVAAQWHVFDLTECVVAPVNVVTAVDLRDVRLDASRVPDASDTEVPPSLPPVSPTEFPINTVELPLPPVTSPLPNNNGSTETSATKATNLIRSAPLSREMTTLEVLCVGDTVRLSNKQGALHEVLYAVPAGGDALTVSVYDITGPNAGNGVAGLQVSGAITTTRSRYTMVFEVKVEPEDYQYNMTLYGTKRLEAKWKDTIILSANVLFKPSSRLRPRAALALYNAVDDCKVAAGTVGSVLISSHDDPRSTPDRPLFPAIRVPYTGGNIVLPPGLPDGIISVTPDIAGYSSNYSEKFVMFNGETSTEVQKMMLSGSDLTGEEWRVVLSWGEHPQDLDLYCITDFEPRRVYFGAKNAGGRNDASKGNIELDIDVRSGFGPETITFSPNATKKYRFLVHNYTGNGRAPLSGSGAKIVVNKSTGRPMQFEVPTDIVLDDNGGFAVHWHVFDLVNGALVPVNQVIKEDLRNIPL